MGSGAETTEETVNCLTGCGEKVGILKVRLYRPFSVHDFVHALPATTRTLAVLDRTKEPGAVGEPLYQDTVAAMQEASDLGLLPWIQPASHRRRPLRAFLQGIHAGHGEGRFRRAYTAPAEKRISRSALSMTLPTCLCRMTAI